LMDPLTLVLLVVAVLTLGVLRQVLEGAAIAAIVVLNVAIGVGQERRAQLAIEALEDLTAPTTRVRRGGRSLTIPAAGVVRGDLVELAAGDRVPADLAIIQAWFTFFKTCGVDRCAGASGHRGPGKRNPRRASLEHAS